MVARSIASLLRSAAQTAGIDAVAVREGEQSWSYGEWIASVQQLAAGLKERFQLQPSDRVALLFWNQPECWQSFMALRWLGVVPVPLNLMMPPDDLLYVLQDAAVKGVLASTDLVAQLVEKLGVQAAASFPFWVVLSEEAESFPLNQLPTFQHVLEACPPAVRQAKACAADFPPYEPDSDALAILLYTSGTTARPKGVMLSEANMLHNMQGFSEALSIEPRQRMLLGIPLFHAYGLICALYSLHLGATLILTPRFNPKRIVSDIADKQVSLLPLVPTMYHLVAALAEKQPASHFASLRYCISGGAALPPSLLRQSEQSLGAVILEGYGLTETSPVIAVNTPAKGSIAGCVGPVLPNLEVRLTQEDGSVIPWQPGQASEEGEIEVRGPSVMLGYLNQPEATAAALCADGWFKTGDLGHLDAEGNLVISGGRKKELIIRAGENIAPVKIEMVVLEHPIVDQVAVLGLPDSKLGEAICAVVCLKEQDESNAQASTPDALTAESILKAFCREKLPAFLQPDRWIFESDLPKTPTGKLLKKELKAFLQDRQLVSNS